MKIRLFIAFSIIILITLGSVGFWIQRNTIQEITHFAQRGGFYGIEGIADSLEVFYARNDSWEGVFKFIGSMDADTQMHGRMMSGNLGNQPQNNQISPSMQRNDIFAIADTDGNVIYGAQLIQIEKLSEDQLEYTIPLYNKQNIIGYLIPPGTYFPNYDYIDILGERIKQASYISISFAGALALAFAIVLGYFLTKPINVLEQAANKMAEGDYSQRVKISSSPELKSLGETFNKLAESIQHHRKSRTAMTADIAHELRTPLAIQRANLEAIQDGIYPLDQDNIELILEQNNMLSKLVEDLRTLAQSDEKELKLFFEDSDLSYLIKNYIDAFQAQSEKNKIKLNYQFEDNIPLIPIDNYRLQQVMNNLLHNALRHTPEGGEIKVDLSKTSENIIIKIIDSGPGIPPEAISKIFKRFYRADSSRSREFGGTGLGLTIAKRFIEAHGGTLTADNHPEAGAEFKITFPI